jgi:hypothetical protein
MLASAWAKQKRVSPTAVENFNVRCGARMDRKCGGVRQQISSIDNLVTILLFVLGVIPLTRCCLVIVIAFPLAPRANEESSDDDDASVELKWNEMRLECAFVEQLIQRLKLFIRSVMEILS